MTTARLSGFLASASRRRASSFKLLLRTIFSALLSGTNSRWRSPPTSSVAERKRAREDSESRLSPASEMPMMLILATKTPDQFFAKPLAPRLDRAVHRIPKEDADEEAEGPKPEPGPAKASRLQEGGQG